MKKPQKLQGILNYIKKDVNSLINESINSERKPFIVQGIIQKANAPNGNKRVYPKSILKREIDKYIKKINDRTSDNTGEVNHPEDDHIDLMKSSHRFLKIWWEGNEVWGQIEILNTPSGLILQELFNSGLKVGISSRGMGSVETDYETGLEIVQDDYELVCWDFVATPSTPGAWTEKLQESQGYNQKYLKENKRHLEILNNINNTIDNIVNNIL